MIMAETDDKTTRIEDEPLPVVMDEPQAQTAAPPEPARPAPAPSQRRGGMVGPVIGGILAAAAGFGLAQVVPNGWPLQDTAVLEQQLAAQSETIATLQSRLAAVEGAKVPDITPLMDTLAALNGRVAALETGPAERAEETAALAKAVADLQQQIVTLPAAPGQAAVPANITALAAEAEARLQEAEAQAAQMKAEAEALTRTAVAQAALGRLQAALDAGTPYVAILPDLGQEIPEALQAHAETGLPSLPDLQQSFPEAARLALETALRADMGDTWTERATSFLRSQTGVRSLTPREGTDPDAILSRAEAALDTGDLGKALQELATLPEVAQAPLAAWVAQVQARQAGLQALDALAAQIGG